MSHGLGRMEGGAVPDATAHLMMVHSGKTWVHEGAHPKVGGTHELFTYGIFLKTLSGRTQLTTGECMDKEGPQHSHTVLGERLGPRWLMVTSYGSVSKDGLSDQLNGGQQGWDTLLSRPLPKCTHPPPFPSQKQYCI